MMTRIKPLLPTASFEEIHGSSFRETLYLVAVLYGSSCSLSWHLWTTGGF